jgi:hypothetical protein
MEKYETPEIKVIELDVEDVITTSEIPLNVEDNLD